MPVLQGLKMKVKLVVMNGNNMQVIFTPKAVINEPIVDTYVKTWLEKVRGNLVRTKKRRSSV
jgi:phosphotransferase system IIB component